MEKNYKVMQSPELSTKWETRYVVVDTNTGEILDDAQGYGYRTAQKAYSAYGYKTRDKSKDAQKRNLSKNDAWFVDKKLFCFNSRKCM